MMIKTGKTVIKPCLYFHCTDLSINGQRSANSVFESGVAKMTATSGEAVGYSQASYSVLREGSEAWHAPFSTTDCALLSHIQKTASLGFREHFDSPSSNPIYPVDWPWLSPPTKIWSSFEPLLELREWCCHRSLNAFLPRQTPAPHDSKLTTSLEEMEIYGIK